jgi:hypothetical protein
MNGKYPYASTQIVSVMFLLLTQPVANAHTITSVATPLFRRQPWKNLGMILTP